MNSNITRNWIEAGIKLSTNPNSNVVCPECEKVNLCVKDIMDENETTVLERIIYCENCGAKNFIRLNKSVETPKQ